MTKRMIGGGSNTMGDGGGDQNEGGGGKGSNMEKSVRKYIISKIIKL